MSGRSACVLLALALASSLLGAAILDFRRLRANATLQRAETAVQLLYQTGSAARPAMRGQIRALLRAHRLDPSDSRILLALGSYHLLLEEREEAVHWYQRAIELAPRPEIYFSLGMSEAQIGREEEALQAFKRAALLSRPQARDVPEPYRSRLPPELTRRSR